MKNSILKTILIIIGITIGIIILDSVQAFVFDNNPFIKIKEYYNGGDLNYKSKGLLVDTINCSNGNKDTVIKGFSYSCSYNGGNYKLIDKTKNKLNFICEEVEQKFYEEDNYIYYWECMKDSYMIVKYDDGYEETISEALKQKHIDIQVLDKFEIFYIKEIKNLQLHNRLHNYQK